MQKYKKIKTGEKFGNWEILNSEDFEQKKGYKKYLCKCNCINKTIRYVDERNLKNGSSVGCGNCLHKLIKVGDKFDRWTVLEDETTKKKIKCTCQCGTISFVNKTNLLRNLSTSCGCIQKENHFNNNQYTNNKFKNKDTCINIGEKYNKWTVLKHVKTMSYLCECECDFHTRKVLSKSQLLKNDNNGCKRCRTMPNRPDYEKSNHIGETFGYLTILGINVDATNVNGKYFVDAKCKCGNRLIADKNSIIIGRTKSCGCKIHEVDMSLIGKKFNHLTVLGFVERKQLNNGKSVLIWKCRCDCGKEINIRQGNLLNNTWSCGCMKRSHGEKTIYDFLYRNQFEFEEQYRIDDCRNQLPLPFDFAIFKNGKLSCLIEFDGRQHFEPYQFNNSSKSKAIENFKQYIVRDNIKTTYCKEHKIPLLRVTYEDLESGDLLYKVWDFLESRKLIEKVS